MNRETGKKKKEKRLKEIWRQSVSYTDSQVISSHVSFFHFITPQQLVNHMSYSELHQIVGAANKAATRWTLPD